MNANEYCAVCGVRVFTGRVIEYEYPPGLGCVEQDVEGDFARGAGRCEYCEKCFCFDCKDLEDGLCPECRERGDGEFTPL